MAESKILLKLEEIDADGLIGPEDGKRAVSYKFAVSDTPENRHAVQRIDATLQIQCGGRSGPGRVLCIGSTHQPGWKDVLMQLAALEIIEKIEPMIWT